MNYYLDASDVNGNEIINNMETDVIDETANTILSSEIHLSPTETSRLEETNAMNFNNSIQPSDDETINNMELDANFETLNTSVSNEINLLSTSANEMETFLSEYLIGATNNSIEPIISPKNDEIDNNIPMDFVSGDSEKQLNEPDKGHSMKSKNKLRMTRNNIWSKQKFWRKPVAINSYASRDLVDYSDGEYYSYKCVFLHLIFNVLTILITSR